MTKNKGLGYIIKDKGKFIKANGLMAKCMEKVNTINLLKM